MPDVVRVKVAFQDKTGHHDVDSTASFPTETPKQRQNLANLVELGIVEVVGGTGAVVVPTAEPSPGVSINPAPPKLPPPIPPIIPQADQPEGA